MKYLQFYILYMWEWNKNSAKHYAENIWEGVEEIIWG
jgi:hypothetical protein